ncbi:MAG: type II toxin-antitoxin system RelE/ParE family toxin [Clostridium sp.]|nr:type II toxin-antitoxin system RelE/ParE family toxin [Clostridium sp.]
MGWKKDINFEVVLTQKAEEQIQKIIDYIFDELGNAQAAYSVEQDMKETVKRLSYIADSLKLCDAPKFRTLGYRTIHLKQHKYFMLYKIIDTRVYVIGVYHDLQDYENILV